MKIIRFLQMSCSDSQDPLADKQFMALAPR